LWFFKSKDNVEVVLVSVSLIYKEQSIFRITWPIPFITTLGEQNMSYLSFKTSVIISDISNVIGYSWYLKTNHVTYHQIFMFISWDFNGMQNSWPLTAFWQHFYGPWNFVPFLCHEINYCYCNPCKSH